MRHARSDLLTSNEHDSPSEHHGTRASLESILVGGVVVNVLGASLFGFVLGFVSAGIARALGIPYASDEDTLSQVLSVVARLSTLLFAFLGGFVAATLRGEAFIRHAMYAGVLAFFLNMLWASATFLQTPLTFLLLFLLVLLPCSAAGGWLAKARRITRP